MKIASESPGERIPFTEPCSQQELHLLVRVDPHFKLRSAWDDLEEDQFVYGADLQVAEYSTAMLGFDLQLHLVSHDGPELVRTCQRIVAAGAVEVWGQFTLDFVGGDIHPRLDVAEFRVRELVDC